MDKLLDHVIPTGTENDRNGNTVVEKFISELFTIDDCRILVGTRHFNYDPFPVG